jgi:hypothetical protein
MARPQMGSSLTGTLLTSAVQSYYEPLDLVIDPLKLIEYFSMGIQKREEVQQCVHARMGTCD